jgi:hypothetical protein
VGLLEALLGGRRRLKAPAADRLFAMSTAYVTLETGLGIKGRNVAGIVFQPLATADFGSIVSDTEELLRGTAEESGTEVQSADDEYGFRWLILRDSDFDDLVVALNTVSTELQSGGYGDRLLCCVFAFEDSARPPDTGRTLYLIYNFKRGAFYPFVPAPREKARDSERELRLKAQIGAELPFEQDLTRWFPLWEIPL